MPMLHESFLLCWDSERSDEGSVARLLEEYSLVIFVSPTDLDKDYLG